MSNTTLQSGYLTDRYAEPSREVTPIKTEHRRIATAIPAPETRAVLEASRELFAQVNLYQPPIVWERAEGYQVFDCAGNCWIDFTSTAVMTNAGHGHPAIREVVREHAEKGMLAHFNFPTGQRVELARRLLALCPAHMEKVYFWTSGSEAIESAFRMARAWGVKRDAGKDHVLTHTRDFHGITLAATQLSGESAGKDWLASPDSRIHHLPFPGPPEEETKIDGAAFFKESIARLEGGGVASGQVAAVIIETMQGWGAVPYPREYLLAMREWADANDVLLVFDEIQTGFGRTGRMFGHEHYGVKADLICIGKGLSSSLPIAAVVGSGEVLDCLPLGSVTTTHAAHPLSCAAALANLDVFDQENLVAEAERKGRLVEPAMRRIQERFPKHIARFTGKGLLWTFHVRNPRTGELDPDLAAEWTWATVQRGVMLFHTMRPSIKICPPLIIPEEALLEGIEVMGEALESIIP